MECKERKDSPVGKQMNTAGREEKAIYFDAKKFETLVDVLLIRLNQQHPLIHTMVSAVSANFCANVLLAIDAKPVMAEAIEDAAQISAKSDALVLNLGQLSQTKLEAMLKAGRAQRTKKNPADQTHSAHQAGLIVLDPCGCAASAFRRQSALQLIDVLHPDLIRGNASELLALLDSSFQGRGVDDLPAQEIFNSQTEDYKLVERLQQLAIKTQAVIVCSGKVDWICDGTRAMAVFNGTPLLARVTATGCAFGTILAAMAACLSNHHFEAAAWAAITMGLAGQKAQSRLQEGQGTGMFAVYLLDGLGTLNGEWLRKGADYEFFQTDIETLCLNGSKLSSRVKSE